MTHQITTPIMNEVITHLSEVIAGVKKGGANLEEAHVITRAATGIVAAVKTDLLVRLSSQKLRQAESLEAIGETATKAIEAGISLDCGE